MSQETFFYINNKLTTVIDKLPNRSLFFGEGVFETFRYKSELPAYFNRHIERLNKGCEFLNIPIPSELIIKGFIQDSLIKSQITDAHMKLCIFSSGGNIYQDHSDGFLLALVIKQYIARDHEMKICISKESKNSTSSLNFHKTTNYLQNILSKRQAVKNGFQEALFLNEKDYITECTAHNIFWTIDDKLYTPALKNGLLPGITRGLIIEISEELGIEVIESDFGVNYLKKADFIFLSNAISGIIAVNELMGYVGDKRGEIYENIMQNLLTRLKWN